MNVLLVDDHAMFRQGLRFLLSDLDESLTFTEEAGCDRALNLPQDYSPDLILLDLNLPDSKGLDALSRVRERFEDAALVVVSGEEDPAMIRRTIDDGAAGFVPKSSNSDVLIAALRLVLAGGIYLPRISLYAQEASNSSPKEPPEYPVHKLSKRQVEVLRLAIQGKSNKSIAREINVAEGTVKAHLSAAYRVIGVANRTEAVYAAARYGITTRDP